VKVDAKVRREDAYQVKGGKKGCLDARHLILPSHHSALVSKILGGGMGVGEGVRGVADRKEQPVLLYT
jgi:hypothetical protein